MPRKIHRMIQIKCAVKALQLLSGITVRKLTDILHTIIHRIRRYSQTFISRKMEFSGSIIPKLIDRIRIIGFL